ncbi:XshC-Cox1-family protein [Streptomyces cinnamoneus]|uniref:XshC-Cox1-family protein n=1 Tax=Streptomyces cinnamoneus TaxID=53446 RepID=A0A2G1XNH5_STRCJ|nr:XdhC/CoxI family protein [Streptomyces cinnamoneus]PHQ52731.1 XshC-Cox1-family protein [Streptomyces cinnamoneus]PPT11826.1 XshC-Cox1-family protein [Streptomyces cinnamoneus]
MLDIAPELSRWCAQGRDFAVATVVATQGSAPRRPGAALAVDADGTVTGSVSGGCVEAAVYELCRQALTSGTSVLERFGHDADDPFAAGLSCGGAIDVLVTPVPAGTPDADTLADALTAAARGEAVALVRGLDSPAGLLGRVLLVRPDGTGRGSLGGDARLDGAAAEEARALLGAGRTSTVRLGHDGSRCGETTTLLIETAAPPPRLVVFGAVDFASALVRVGEFLGFHVTVCDARAVFATRERFPRADEVVVDWPHRYLDSQRLDGRAALCVLTHDARFDVPLLERALRLPVAYVGAMGSRRTHHERLRRLREAGLTEAELARLRSPIGLDLGARTPEETALSIASEIVAERHGGTGRPLTGLCAPIHRDPSPGRPVRAGLPAVDGSGAGHPPRRVRATGPGPR